MAAERPLLFCCGLFILFGVTTAALDDKVDRYFWGTAGKGNAKPELHFEVTDGEQNLLMITEVHIGYYKQGDIKDIRCVQFFYGDEANPCVSSLVEEKDIFVLESDEYIIEVSGNDDYFIKTLSMKTNKRTIGPYGQPAAGHEFTASHKGSPLLYSSITAGLWVYEMSFTFYGTEDVAPEQVLNLTDVANKVATETNNALNTNLTSIMGINADYQHMLVDVARKVCVTYPTEQTPEALTGCNLQHLLGQISVMASSVNAHFNHAARNLVPYKNTDMTVILTQLQQAKEFHKLANQLNFGIQAIINITLQQSKQLNDYFSAQAKFDREVAEQDVAYIRGQLERTKAGSAETADKVGKRLINIIDVGIAMAVTEAIDKMVQIGVLIAENLNPVKLLFSGPDFGEIFDAIEEFLEQVRNIAKLSYLRAHVQDYLDMTKELARKFAENEEQIAAMNEIVEKFDTASEDEVIQLSEDYIQAYGAYTPQVTEQDIVYLTTILDAIGDESCSIMEDTHGIGGDLTAAIYESVMQDCLYLPADQATLDSYYEDTYSLQFELVDAMTNVVRYSVAGHMADNIGAIGTVIDVQSTTIGICMLELQYQTSAQARCDILEYVGAGFRGDACKPLLFTDLQILNLIAYESTFHVSKRYDFAYFPTSSGHATDFPYIGIDKLLRGESQTLMLPVNNTEWLQKYKWLPGYYDPETAFYYELIEAFIPGLTCNETNQNNARVYVELVSAKPQTLYKEESEPTFTTYQHLVKFTYDTNPASCPGKYVSYAVVRNDTDDFEADLDVEVCVISPGEVASEIIIETRDDYTLPSLYSMWELKIRSDQDCTLVFEPEFSFYPLVTFKVTIREVMVKADESEPGIDECWPEGSRCPAEQLCSDELLGFTCQETKKDEEDTSMFYSQVTDLLTNIRDGIYMLVNLFQG